MSEQQLYKQCYLSECKRIQSELLQLPSTDVRKKADLLRELTFYQFQNALTLYAYLIKVHLIKRYYYLLLLIPQQSSRNGYGACAGEKSHTISGSCSTQKWQQHLQTTMRSTTWHQIRNHHDKPIVGIHHNVSKRSDRQIYYAMWWKV